MATKAELLEQLEAAGAEGFSMDNTKDELVDAVENLDPVVSRLRGV